MNRQGRWTNRDGLKGEIAREDMRATIRSWMRANWERFIDPTTRDVNLTLMVETWDNEVADGSETLNSDHPAWEVATEFGEDANLFPDDSGECGRKKR